MKRTRSFPPFFVTLIITLSLLASSCVENGGSGTTRKGISSSTGTTTSGGSTTSGNGAGPSDNTVGNITDEILEGGIADLRHIVDPFTGTYKTKVTIPKNYKGLLYLSGLNIAGLSDKLVSVRFRFGREREEIIIPATIGIAQGITPQTNVRVLILDLEDQPFQDLRLPYDLFDYNDYDTDDDGVEFGPGDDLSEPTNDPRDSGLYCRGLLLEDDPTFTISTLNDKCDAAGETCLYSYAKILDSALYYNDNGNFLGLTPSEPQIDLTSNGYATEDQSELLKKCLPDTNHRASVKDVLQALDSTNTTVFYGDQTLYNGFTYFGPYRPANINEWELSFEAAFSDMSVAGTEPSGLFQKVLSLSPTNSAANPNEKANGGFQSFLFPRSGRMDLRSNVEYIGFSDVSNAASEARTIRSLVSAGESNHMDGCNLRVSSFKASNTTSNSANESIASCTVTGTIDLIYTDRDTNEVNTITTSRDLKLQITRASETDFEGNEVRYSALTKCSNSNACGSDECCFNERCWSNNLVSQCLEDVAEEGNLNTGEVCNSDFQCSSLCCSSTSNTCAPHNADDDVLCSKSPGQACVTKEFCRKENIPTCFIVKTGTNNQGQTTCTRRCYNVPTFGDCTAGTCVPPQVPEVPAFDPENPDCSTAIDPPTNL